MRVKIIDLLFEVGRFWSPSSDVAHRLPEIRDACPKFSSPRPAERGAWLIEKHRATGRRSWQKLHIGVDALSREFLGSFRFHVRNYTVSKSPSINRLGEVYANKTVMISKLKATIAMAIKSAIMDTRIPDNIGTPSPSIMPSAITITAKAGMLLPNGIGRKIRSPLSDGS